MGYQVATIHLKDGRRFERVMIVGGTITSINGDKNIPFVEEAIDGITVTNKTSL